MKKSAYRSGQGRMRFSRLVVYLVIVAVFGFLNVYLSQNISQPAQTVGTDKVNDEFQKELVMFTTPIQGETPGLRL
jgi:hypothetical protein